MAEPLKEEGQLAVDVYQTNKEIVIMAPIAGVKPEHVQITITDEVLNIRGRRGLDIKVPEEHYFTRECFWGNFSRSIVLPENVDTNKISAAFIESVLTVTIPKTEKSRIKVVQIHHE